LRLWHQDEMRNMESARCFDNPEYARMNERSTLANSILLLC
jgi:hypothetical protein